MNKLNKNCSKCGNLKPLDLFHKKSKAPDGRMAECKECNAVRSKARRLADPERHKQWITNWREQNSEHLKRYNKHYADIVGEVKLKRTRDWRHRNNNRVLEYAREYGKKHRERYNAHSAKRQALKLQAVPKLNKLDAELNDLVSLEAYSLARERTKLTGVKWHVDHKVPLRSKLVCGFHCYTNLQVIPAKDNLRKSNREWENKW